MLDRIRERVARLMRHNEPSGGTTASRGGSAADPGLMTLENAGRQARPGDIGRLRRERRRMLRAREQSVRDLGGLTLEMVRRDAFKPELLKRRARDILGLEDSVYDLEDALEDARRAIPVPAIGSAPHCKCGAPTNRYDTSCLSCGRVLKRARATANCGQCAATLPVDARYCPSCGTASETTHESPTGAGW